MALTPSTASAAPSDGLTVLSAAPKGETTDLTQITVRFSEAMRALGQMEQPAKTSPLLLSVSGSGAKLPAGAYRWLDPSTLAYIFNEPVKIPLTVSAMVPAGLKSVNGNTLRETVNWKISTPPLAVTLGNKPGETLPRKDGIIRIRTNYPVAENALRAKVRILVNGSAATYSVVRVPQWAQNSGRQAAWEYPLKLKNALPRDAKVTVSVAAGLAAKEGGTPAGKATFTLAAYGSLKVTSWKAGRDGKPMNPDNALGLQFTSPVDYRDLIKHLTVTPSLGDLASFGSYSMSAGYHSLSFPWQPRTRYTVSIAKGLKDANGTVLAKPESFSFTTGDLAPNVLMPNGNIVLESSLGGTFPITVSNADKATVRLRYLPWDQPEAQAFCLDTKKLKEVPFAQIPGAREAFAVLEAGGSDKRETVTRLVDIPARLGFAKPSDVNGPIFIDATATKPGAKQSLSQLLDQNRPTVTQITNLAIALRSGGMGRIMWVTSVDTGKPVSGASVSLRDVSGKTVWSGTTSDRGLARISDDIPVDASLFAMAEKDGDMAALDVSNLSHLASRGRTTYSAFVLAQMPLYQPGQKARFTIFIKERAGLKGERATGTYVSWQAAAGKNVQITLKDKADKAVHTFNGTTNAYGCVDSGFTLHPDAALGEYRAEITFPGDTKASSVFAPAFTVASFRPPDFKVDITPPASGPNPSSTLDKLDRDMFTMPRPLGGDTPASNGSAATPPAPAEHAKPGATLTADVTAGYFSGAALPGGKASLTVMEQALNASPALLRGYRTGPQTSGPPFWHMHPFMLPREVVANLSGTLDASGKTRFSLPDIPRARSLAKSITLRSDVTDASGLVTQGTASFTLHPSRYYVGMRSPYVALAERDATVELKAATFDNKPLSGVSVTLKAERQPKDDNGKPQQVWEKTFTLSREEGERFTVSFAQSGVYMLTASINDPDGRDHAVTSMVYVPGKDLTWYGQIGGNVLEAVYEDREYARGETVRLVLKNPYAQGATALVTVERGGVRRAMLHEVSGPSPVLDVPLQDGDAPFVQVGVALVKGRTAPPPATDETAARNSRQRPDALEDKGAPQLATGEFLIRVAAEKRGLKAIITTDAEEYRPGGKAKVTVSVTDDMGKLRKAQLTLLAVDERILRAAGEKTWYDASKAFADRFNAGMSGMYSLKKLLSYGWNDGRMFARVMSADMALGAENSPMTASAGEAPKADAEPVRLRRDFTPAAYWLASGETDENGTYNAEVTLPDTLTSYRIVAVAADTVETFAYATARIRATLPLQLLSSLPRFVTEGDTLDARILVQNTTASQQYVTVRAEATGAVLSVSERVITLEPDTSGTVSFPLAVPPLPPDYGKPNAEPQGGPARVVLRVVGSAGQDRDAAEFTLPIKASRPLTTVAASGFLPGGGTASVPVSLPGSLVPRSSLTVSLAPTPVSGAGLAAKDLLDYPWNCLEQRTSRAWARIMRIKHGALLGLAPDPAAQGGKAQKDTTNDLETVREIFASIPENQAEDGSFRLWPGMWPGGNGSLYLTAYVLLVAEDAKDLGVTLPAEAEKKAYAYLSATLEGIANGTPAQTSKKRGAPQHIAPGKESPEALALSLALLAGKESVLAASLYPAVEAACREGKANPLAHASLLLALDRLPMVPGRVDATASLLEDLERRAAITPTETHFSSVTEGNSWRTMGSTLRDNAMVLAVLAKTRPEYPRLDALARWVAKSLGEKTVLSTQEAAYGLKGVATYLRAMKAGQAQSTLRAVWNGAAIMDHTFAASSDAPVSRVLTAQELASASSGSLVLGASGGTGYWTARLAYAPAELPAKGENAGFTLTRAVSGTGEWKMGDTVTVTLTLTVPRTRRHVLLFDPFPAGLEPLYASRVDVAQDEKRYQPPWQWQDAREDGMLLYAESVNPGTYTYTYTLRAAAPGSFIQRPAQVEEMYTPEVFGRTKAGKVNVTP